MGQIVGLGAVLRLAAHDVLDKVDGMAGYYAKIESQLDDKEDIKEAREELIKTFEQLGQPKDSLVFDSYAEIA